MSFQKNKFIYLTVVVLAVFGVVGWSLALRHGNQVSADNFISVDRATLETLYDAVFHRPADANGASFYTGRDLKQILNDFRNSDEQKHYGALFMAVKAYEEAQRAPGTLTDTEKKSYTDLIDSALSGLIAWVSTLPDQNPCSATINVEDARMHVQENFDRLNTEDQSKASFGLLNATEHIGRPDRIDVHRRCLSSPPPSVTPTPTETHTSTPTPTPTPTPSHQ